MDMESPEANKSNSCWADGGIDSKASSNWLSDNVEKMDQNVKQMLKMIQEDMNYVTENSEFDIQKRPQLIAHVMAFYHMYRSLAEHYDHLAENPSLTLPSEPQMHGHASSEQGSPLLYSDQKLGGFHMSGSQGLDVSFSSGGDSGSTILSVKEINDFSSSSSDSEAESFNFSADTNGRGFNQKDLKELTEFPSLKEKDQTAGEGNRNELLARIIRTEEELRDSNLKLQLSEKEVSRLKSELEKNQSVILLVESMQAQLDSTQKEIEEKEANIEVEKMQSLELQNQIGRLESHVSDSNYKIGALMEELEVTRDRLKGSGEEIAMLKQEIKNITSDHDREVRELNLALCNTEEKISLEKEQMQTEIHRQFEADKMEMSNFHVAQETVLKGEIDQLKEEIFEKKEQVETLNKDFHTLQLKYDMLMAEKDGVNAKVQELIANISYKDKQLLEMEGHLNHLRTENVGVLTRYESSQKVIDALRLRVEELQEMVDRQIIMISDRADEKREVIRQLCFSLEYYRSSYQELCQAFKLFNGRK